MTNLIDHPSPNFSKGESLASSWGVERTVEAIVIHHWGIDGQDAENVSDWLSDPAAGVSAHEVIDRANVYLLVDWSDAAWHAGSRAWNAKTIGLELRPEADEETFQTARERIKAIRDIHGPVPLVPHGELKATNCPGRWLGLLDKLGETPLNMVSPFQGRLTQNHGDAGGYNGHKGLDIGPPKPGQVGCPAYAMYAGKIKRIYRSAKNGNQSSTWAPGRTGNGLLIENPDGMGQGYNHVKPLRGLKIGDKVKAGQLVGYNDRSGNQSAPHLHLETWKDADDHNSDYNPRIEFDANNIDVGDKPRGTSAPSFSKPSNGPTNYADLIVDGDFGKLSWTAVQILMTQVGHYDRMIDGSAGKYTYMALQAWLADKGYLDTKKYLIDGVFGTATKKALQNRLADAGTLNTKKYLIDGKFGTATKKAFQAFLNTQNGK